MRKKHFTYAAAIALLGMTLLAGCTDGREENQTAYRQIGIAAMEDGDYEGAVEAFDNALAQCIGDIGADELDICYYKAAAQYAGGSTENAIATYTAILEYDDGEAGAYYLRGCLYLQQGNTDAAVSDFGNAVKYDGDDYELYVNIYENLSAYDMAEKGEEYLNEAFSIRGSDADDFAWRGRIYYLLGQYDNAVTELNSALKKESVVANLYLAQVYEALGDSDDAETYYRAYVDSGEADSAAMNALGEVELSRGDYEAALSYFEQGLAMESVTNQRELMQNLIAAYEYTGDFEAARDMAEQYVALYPDDADAQREYIFLKNRIMETDDTEQDTETAEEATETETQTTESGAR